MRKTKVIGFSVPPKIEEKIVKHLKETGKTRSEFMRELINRYFGSPSPLRSDFSDTTDRDMNRILKLYFEMIGMNTKDILVIGLAIIVRDDTVLIGCRKTKDHDVKDLSWVFPGGKMESLNFRGDLKGKTSQETGLDVEVLDIIHARLIPDSPEKSLRIIALYFHCQVRGGTESPGGSLSKLKWVDPTTVCQYFTTSTTDEVMNFLGRIGRMETVPGDAAR